MNNRYPSAQDQQPFEEDADLFDYSKIRDYLAFTAGSVRRRKLLFSSVFLFIVAGAALSLKVLPKTYHVETKLLAQRNGVIGQLGTGRVMTWDFDAPNKSAADLVLRHDNLVSLVQQTDLVHRWSANRAPALQLKDAIMKRLRPPLADDVMLDMMVGTLETKVVVTTGDGTVTIGIDWPDALMGYRLVSAAVQNFLEARHVEEVSTVSDAIGILESHASEVREAVDAGVDELQRAREKVKGNRARNVAALMQRRVAAVKKPAPIDPEATRLRGLLDAKRRAITDLEEFRRRRMSELQTRLAEQKQVYSEFHPAVVDLEQSIQAQQNQEPPQLTQLRAEERELETAYLQRGGKTAEHEAGAALGPLPVEALQMGRDDEVEDPDIEHAKQDLRFQMGKYTSLLDRIDTARMELDTQRAAFRYRYSVLRPAQVPLAPIKPQAPLVMVAAVIAALALAIFSCALADVRKGRIEESWQVERMLELPVLAEVKSS